MTTSKNLPFSVANVISDLFPDFANQPARYSDQRSYVEEALAAAAKEGRLCATHLLCLPVDLRQLSLEAINGWRIVDHSPKPVRPPRELSNLEVRLVSIPWVSVRHELNFLGKPADQGRWAERISPITWSDGVRPVQRQVDIEDARRHALAPGTFGNSTLSSAAKHEKNVINLEVTDATVPLDCALLALMQTGQWCRHAPTVPRARQAWRIREVHPMLPALPSDWVPPPIGWVEDTAPAEQPTKAGKAREARA